MSSEPLPQTRKRRAVTSSAASPLPAATHPATAGTAGFVSFVGAGPGDPALLTVRAVEVIRGADLVLTDQPEAHGELVRQVRLGPEGKTLPLIEVLDVATGDGGTTLTAAARARLVVKHARGGARVVRLLSGDPFTYSTGPEEALACRKAGVDFEVVPGVLAATAVPAYAGVPLTTRGRREVAVVRVADGRVDWGAYAGDQTLVVMSAAARVGDVAARLVAAGRRDDTPVATTLVGTTTEQQTVVSTLGRVGEDIAPHVQRGASVVTVVGEVVGLRESLSWFETKPLFGWRVLVPRTKEQSTQLCQELRGFGAVPEEVPTISVEPPRNPQQMDKAIRGLVEGRYEWVAFTSVNAVKAVREKFDEYGLDARAFSGLKVAAVGDKTAELLTGWGIRPDLVPSGEQSARGLLEEWPPFDEVLDPIDRVFLPRADIATETLVAGLVELGWAVDDVTAYRTVRAAPPPAPVREAIKTGRFDAVVFTSSSTVRNLVGIAGKPHAATVIACIGPATAKTVQEHGLRVDVVAASPSGAELARALGDFAAGRRAELIAAGEPVDKPSHRRATTRRRS